MVFRVSVFYVLTWFFLILLGGIQQETGLLPPEVGLPQWGPGIAALLMLLIFRKDGFKLTFFSKDLPFSRYLTALIPLGMGVLAFLLKSLMTLKSTPDEALLNSLPLVLLWMPLGALGEEIGWRSHLHKKLDMKMNGLLSSVIVGLLWMLIHVHFLGEGFFFLIFLAIWFIAQSIVLYAILYDTGFNILLATLFHWATNLANLLILDVIYETSFWILNSLLWAVLAGILVWVKKDVFLSQKTINTHKGK